MVSHESFQRIPVDCSTGRCIFTTDQLGWGKFLNRGCQPRRKSCSSSFSKEHKKGRPTHPDHHLKESATTNKVKCKSGEGGSELRSKSREGRGQQICFVRSLMLLDVAYPSFNIIQREQEIKEMDRPS